MRVVASGGRFAWRCCRAIALVSFCFLALVSLSKAETRHALVVGIDAYEGVPALRTARNDARSVHRALTEANFASELVEDAGHTAFLEALARFTQKIQPGDIAVFFFAGHGIEIDRQNYLLPSDVPDVEAGQQLVLTSKSISVSLVLDALHARGARVTVLILDACRNNPFENKLARGIGGARGLAAVEPADGTYILYSAGAGQVALDRLSDADADPNSVFTRALVPLISEPGLSLREMTVKVRTDVRKLARSIGLDQFPAVYDQLEGDFEFIAATIEPPRDVIVADPCEAARSDWLAVDLANDIETVKVFISTYTMCPVQIAVAHSKLANLEERSVGAPAAQSDSGLDRPKDENTADSENLKPPLPTPEEAADDLAVSAGEETVEDLERKLQVELKRVGCYATTIDGLWGKGSRDALAAFATYADVTLTDPEPTARFLNLVIAHQDRVCPLVCGPRFTLQEGSCVQKTCAAGLILSAAGDCKKAAKAAPKAAKNCTSFDGEIQFCE